MVHHNRRYLGRLIQAISFLGKQEFMLHGHNEWLVSTETQLLKNVGLSCTGKAVQKRKCGIHRELQRDVKWWPKWINWTCNINTEGNNRGRVRDCTEFMAVLAHETLNISSQLH